MYKKHIIQGVAIFVILGVVFLCGRACNSINPSSKQQAIHDTITVTKQIIKTEKKEVVKWKQAKSQIHYVTHFDTLATIDTVIVELIKCDQVVKIDSNIIASQDTVIVDQDKVISLSDKEKKALKRANRRQNVKVFFAGFGIGFITGILVPL